MYTPPTVSAGEGLLRWGKRLVQRLNLSADALPGIVVLDAVADGSTSHVRARATPSTSKIRLQVQSTGAGKGGASYSASDYVSRTDLPAGGMVDLDVVRNGVDRYIVFAIPITRALGGGETVHDGQNETTDLVRWVDLGV